MNMVFRTHLKRLNDISCRIRRKVIKPEDNEHVYNNEGIYITLIFNGPSSTFKPDIWKLKFWDVKKQVMSYGTLFRPIHFFYRHGSVCSPTKYRLAISVQGWWR
jgi:hypothetical protein